MEGNRKILIVDNEDNIINILGIYLKNSNYSVCEAINGKEALILFEKINPSLVILDLNLPDIKGEELCISLRKKSMVPIIIATAKSKEEDILNGFEIGADDYIIKPFNPKQLVARVGMLLRRTDKEFNFQPDIISINQNEVTIDNLKHEVKKNGNIINFTFTEYNIFLMLVQNPDKVFSREELLKCVSKKQNSLNDRIIDTHIKNIRHKIQICSMELIKTVRSNGYKFTGETNL